jgi:uncharacterized protein YfcZ (UPF0381/DUF406 family)
MYDTLRAACTKAFEVIYRTRKEAAHTSQILQWRRSAADAQTFLLTKARNCVIQNKVTLNVRGILFSQAFALIFQLRHTTVPDRDKSRFTIAARDDTIRELNSQVTFA